MAQVILQTQLQTLSAVVEERRKSNPAIKLAYFEMTESPENGDPGRFTLKKLHDVRFVPAGAAVEGGPENQETTQASAATLLPLQAWQSNLPQSLHVFCGCAVCLFGVDSV